MSDGTIVCPALEVRNLRVGYGEGPNPTLAVDDLSFDVHSGELVGLLGESGCGKTTTAMALLGLLAPPGRVLAGSAVLGGTTDLLNLTERARRPIRWRDIAIVPQGAMNSLNPVMRVRSQVIEVIKAHSETKWSRAELTSRCQELLELVNLSADVMTMYPHELSGGMKQRVCIAMAIALNPTLLIADEPTSALDVIVQRVIAQTILDIRERLGVSVLMIGHDVGLMSQMADQVIVMRSGKSIEQGSARQVLEHPEESYTRELLAAVPSINFESQS